MATDAEWTWLAGEVRAEAKAFAQQIRSAPDLSIRVPNLDWTVAELAAHVASLASLYRTQHELGADFERPADWAAFSIAARAHIATSDAHELADLIVGEAESLLELGEADPNRQRWLYGCQTTVRHCAAGLLTKLVLHGQDLGRITGAKPQLTRRRALAGIEQQMILTPAFVDPAKAAKVPGTYGLSFRGGKDYTFHVADGVLSVSPGKPAKADARTNADPAAFLMSSLGRMSNTKAGLTGKIVGYGRKPWRLIALGEIAVDGV